MTDLSAEFKRGALLLARADHERAVRGRRGVPPQHVGVQHGKTGDSPDEARRRGRRPSACRRRSRGLGPAVGAVAAGAKHCLRSRATGRHSLVDGRPGGRGHPATTLGLLPRGRVAQRRRRPSHYVSASRASRSQSTRRPANAAGIHREALTHGQIGFPRSRPAPATAAPPGWVTAAASARPIRAWPQWATSTSSTLPSAPAPSR